MAIKFILALLPLLVVLIGIIALKQSGAVMAIVGWVLAVVLAVGYFRTTWEVVFGASLVGLIKSLGITVAVIFTMLMVFIMKECGALSVIGDAMKRVAKNREEQALFVGMGFGSFVTALGVVTPALFPPLLVAMGFSPFSAVAIAILGYDPLTSFALLAIPITLPAETATTNFGIPVDAQYFAYKICIYLPVISVGFALAMLWVVGGKGAIKRGFIPALISGLVISFSALGLVVSRVVPLSVVGVFAGLLSMLSLYLYYKFRSKGRDKEVTDEKRLDIPKLLKAFSPWIILIALVVIINMPFVKEHLADALGENEVINVFADQDVDLNILTQIYTWILVAIIISLPILRPKKSELKESLNKWVRRIWGPMIAYSVYFSISFIMFFSAMEVVNGELKPTDFYEEYNMDRILGITLATVFGAGFAFVAGSLGLFGAFVGGSETSSNVMFVSVQNVAAEQTGTDFMTIYGAHAVAGGIASAITPSKINNAVATLGESSELESKIMRKHIVIALILTIALGIMTGIFVNLGI